MSMFATYTRTLGLVKTGHVLRFCKFLQVRTWRSILERRRDFVQITVAYGRHVADTGVAHILSSAPERYCNPDYLRRTSQW